MPVWTLSGSFFFWRGGRLDDCLHIQNSGLEDFSLCAMKVETSNEELVARFVDFKKINKISLPLP